MKRRADDESLFQVCHVPPISSASAGLHLQRLDHPLHQGAKTDHTRLIILLSLHVSVSFVFQTTDIIQRITHLFFLSSLPPSMGPSFIASTSAFVLSAVTGILPQILLNGEAT